MLHIFFYQQEEILNLNIIVFQQPILEEPRISLPESFGACVKAPAEVNVALHDDNVRDPNAWSVNWHIVNDWSWKPRTLISQDSTILRLPQPTLQQTGERYEVDVRNPFGLARGMSRIIVTAGNRILLYIAPHNFPRYFQAWDELGKDINHPDVLLKEGLFSKTKKMHYCCMRQLIIQMTCLYSLGKVLKDSQLD